MQRGRGGNPASRRAHGVCGVEHRLSTGALTSPATSCKEINDLYGPGLPSETYWLESADGETRYPVYCDMSTEGGGWTLVSKLRGNTPALSRAQHSAWCERQYIGDISDIVVEDALGPSFEHVEFTDVMLMGINTPSPRTGWRHPSTYDQYNTGSFVGHNMPNGRAGGIVAMSVFRDSAGAGADSNCITDFGFGGGTAAQAKTSTGATVLVASDVLVAPHHSRSECVTKVQIDAVGALARRPCGI